jgi:hypothetical protein
MWCRRARFAGVAVGVLLTGLLPGCGGSGSAEDHGSLSGPKPSQPLTISASPNGGGKGTVLLLWDAHEYVGTVPVEGTFGVDDNGCFVIGDQLVEAAMGSRVVQGGRAVHVRLVGTLHVGDRVKVNAEIATLGSPLYSDATTCLAGRPSAPVLRLISAA